MRSLPLSYVLFPSLSLHLPSQVLTKPPAPPMLDLCKLSPCLQLTSPLVLCPTVPSAPRSSV